MDALRSRTKLWTLFAACCASVLWAQGVEFNSPSAPRPAATSGSESQPVQAEADRRAILESNVLRARLESATPAVGRNPPAAGAPQPAAPSPGENAAAVVPGAPEAPPLPKLVKDDIAQRIEVIQKDTELDETARAELIKRLQKSGELLVQAEEQGTRATQFAADIQQAPKLVEETTAKLAAPAPESGPGPVAADEIPKIEQQLTQLQTRLTESQNELAKREMEIKRRGERKAELTKLVADTTQKLDELRLQRAAPPAANEKPQATLVTQTELDVREILLFRQLEAAKLESQRMDARIQLAPLQRDLVKRAVSGLEKEVAVWQRALADRRKTESVNQAEEARRQVQNAHPALRQLAERNAVLAEKRRLIAASIENIETEARALNNQVAQLTSDFDRLSERIKVARMTRTNGILLRKQRADLTQITVPYDRLRFIEKEMPVIQLALIEYEDERSSLGDVETLVADVDSKLPEDAPLLEREMVLRMASDLFTKKRDLLDKIIYDYNAYIKELSELEFSARSLLEQTDRLSAFIDQHVLWIRSSEALGLSDIQRAATSVAYLIDARLWISLCEKTLAGLWKKPLHGSLALLLVLTLIVLRHRICNRLKNLCVEDTTNKSLHFLPTLEALLLLAVVSSIWPGLLWCAGWWLQSANDVDDFSVAIAAGLQRGGMFLLLLQLVRNATQPDGIGESQFGWYPSGTRVVRGCLRWIGAIGIPLAIAVSVVGAMEDGQRFESLGRIAFMAGMVVTVMGMHHVFRKQKGMFHEALSRSQESWLRRVRLSGYLAGTGIPCLLSVLAAAGYYYSARQLAIRFEWTLVVVLGVGLAHGVASRWFHVKRRNLAIKQARERRGAQGDQPVDPKAALPPPNLSKIQSQLQVLLRYVVVLAILMVTWYIWADVLPALHFLDRIELWNSNDAPTTLMHGLLALLFLVGTCVTGKNLPALLEITILERLPMDHGGRNAAAILSRYLVYLAGVILVARTLNISWSSVQWLAAAMTVGLGFGLQEIFANLVSGLIILFERPVRVGDIVTVNGVTGTVTRMQIRATTILDWERRELVVPNKKFITEDVINWTLTDPITRIAIEVGIAYGSDTELAHSILKQVAAEHPLVLLEPPPFAMFRRFGESTLDFSLFVFIPSREHYGVVLHELHTAIDREFRKAKIEIAFPQRDLNIRSIDSSVIPLARELTQSKAA